MTIVIPPLPSGNATMPIGEQIRFLSSRTGAWVLDTYLEAGELGNRTIPDLLADLFDQNGQLILSGLNNWMGFWQAGQSYRKGDTFKDATSTTAYVTIQNHVSSSIGADLAAGHIDEVIGTITGPTGPPGLAGPPGPAGQTIKVLFSFGQTKTPANLPPSGLIPANWDGTNQPATAHQFVVGEGMSYLPTNTSDPLYRHVYGYVGVAMNPAGWVDYGAIIGPPGGPGAAYVVVAHLTTNPPDVNNPTGSVSPPNGLLVIDLDDNSWGQASIPAGGTTGQVLAKHSPTDYDTQWQNIPAGPTGPQGPPGATGPQGPQGTPGLGGGLPEAPTDGQTYGRKGSTTSWQSVLPLAGGTLAGALTLAADPTAALGAVTKQYSDTKLPLAGGTLTGALTISTPAGTDANLVLNKAAGRGAQVIGENAGSVRWVAIFGDATAESGSNAGSNFQLNAFSDAGVSIGSALYANRATGQVTIPGYGSTGAGTLFNAVGDASLVLNKKLGSNQVSAIFGTANGVSRWTLRLGNGAGESGANAGSDLAINRYSDTGAVIDNPLMINRATGQVTLTQQLNATVIIANTNVQVNPASGAAWYYATCPGVREWAWGANTDGGYYILDVSASNAVRFRIDTAGNTFITASLTVSGNFTTNAIACTTLTASGIIRSTGARVIAQGGAGSNPSLAMYDTAQGVCNVLFIGGSNIVYLGNADGNGNYAGSWYQYWQGVNSVIAGNLTVNGNFNTNAITGSSLNVGGGTVTCGPLNASSTVQISGSTGLLYLTANGVRQWYLQVSTNGYLYFVDQTVGAVRFYCDTGGSFFTNGNALYTGYINGAYIDLSNGAGIGFAQQGGASRKSFTSTGQQLTHYINGGAAGSWNFNAPSDERVKRNISEAEGDHLAELRQVKLISFDEAFFGKAHVGCGFSAQQLKTAIPEAVIEAPYFHGEEDERPNPVDDGMMLSVDVMPLIARLVGAVQQMAKRIETLEGAR